MNFRITNTNGLPTYRVMLLTVLLLFDSLMPLWDEHGFRRLFRGVGGGVLLTY